MKLGGAYLLGTFTLFYSDLKIYSSSFTNQNMINNHCMNFKYFWEICYTALMCVWPLSVCCVVDCFTDTASSGCRLKTSRRQNGRVKLTSLHKCSISFNYVEAPTFGIKLFGNYCFYHSIRCNFAISKLFRSHRWVTRSSDSAVNSSLPENWRVGFCQHS